eukprot:scaffold1885_cov72-Skeletonema_dohrnii-CCMP3373.AAC.1
MGIFLTMTDSNPNPSPTHIHHTHPSVSYACILTTLHYYDNTSALKRSSNVSLLNIHIAKYIYITMKLSTASLLLIAASTTTTSTTAFQTIASSIIRQTSSITTTTQTTTTTTQLAEKDGDDSGWYDDYDDFVQKLDFGNDRGWDSGADAPFEGRGGGGRGGGG